MRWTCRDTGEVGRGGRWFGAIGTKCILCGGALDGLTCVVELVEEERGEGTLCCGAGGVGGDDGREVGRMGVVLLLVMGWVMAFTL